MADSNNEFRTNLITAIAGLCVLALLVGFMVWQPPRTSGRAQDNSSSGGLPQCDSSDGIEQAKKALRNGVEIFRLSDAKEVRFDEGKKVRDCVAVVITSRAEADGNAVLIYRFRDLGDQYITWATLYGPNDVQSLPLRVEAAGQSGQDSDEARNLQDLLKYIDLRDKSAAEAKPGNAISADEFLREHSQPSGTTAQSQGGASSPQHAGTPSPGIPVSADEFLKENSKQP